MKSIPFPAHSCISPTNTQMASRCISPLDEKKVLHFLVLVISAVIVLQIQRYSYWTSSSSMSPFAWYFPRIARASSFLPLDTSHLGLSGTNTINPRIWNNGYDICSRQGSLHDQLFDMPIVAYVTAAELMAPKLQHALYRAVAVCRCRGCAFSVARRGAAVWAMPIPMPDKILVPKKAQ